MAVSNAWQSKLLPLACAVDASCVDSRSAPDHASNECCTQMHPMSFPFAQVVTGVSTKYGFVHLVQAWPKGF